MRSIFISFIISLIFFGIFNYFLTNLEVIDPAGIEMVQEQYSVTTNAEFLDLFEELRGTGLVYNILNKDNFYGMLIMFSLFVLSTFASLHLFIDKIFFKRFYEQPNLIIALRRGVMLGMFLDLLILMRLWAFWEIWTVILAVIIFGFIEFVIMRLSGGNFVEEEEVETEEEVFDYLKQENNND